jgi:type II secretory pathway component PulF
MSTTNGAQINIKALAEFNRSLILFASKLSDSMSQMEQSINTLEQQSKDEKFKEFKVSMSGHVKKLQPLSDELKRYKEHSEKEWIPLIEQYLKNNIGK